jgi:tricarballylate dehydrogenase
MDVRRKFDCDVLIVGGGNAGLVASLETHNRGANVLLIEKAPRKLRGGNSRFSGGLFRIAYPRGTKDFEPLVQGMTLPKGELEIEPYHKDDFYNKVMNLSEGLADRRATEIFVEKSLETVVWMKKQGLDWSLFWDFMVRKEDRLFFPNTNNVLQALGEGEGLVEMLYGILEKQGIKVLYETSATSLILNEMGAVCGVIAKDTDGFLRINAKSVIMSCGGFQASPEWRRRCLGENWDLVKLRGTRYDTGDGLRMALEVGAQTTGHWGGCHASIVSEDSPMIEAASAGSDRYSYYLGILVNRKGERFVDEGEDLYPYTYAKFGKEILKQPGSIAFQIYDGKVIPRLRAAYQNAIRVECKSLEQLAEDSDIQVEQFMTTIKEYNEAIVDDQKLFVPYRLDGRRTKGLKPDKSNWAQKIDTPPYRAYGVVCGLTMTYGGLKTNERAQVIDTSDRPIPRLYAVGEITGGFFYHNYPSGTGLVRGAVMARIAASDAVTTCK